MTNAISFAALIGWVFSFSLVAPDMWNWFIVPLGAPLVGKAHAWGLLVTRWVFFQKLTLGKDEGTEEEKCGRALLVVCGLWFSYGVGWICQKVM